MDDVADVVLVEDEGRAMWVRRMAGPAERPASKCRFWKELIKEEEGDEDSQQNGEG